MVEGGVCIALGLGSVWRCIFECCGVCGFSIGKVDVGASVW